jgi:Ser/Thr protein kinase RdoA (MazF antagonist)
MKAFQSLSHRGQVRRLKEMARVALADYDLSVARVKPLFHVENTTFRVWAADGSRYVMRITRPGKQTVEGVRSEMQWLAALRRDTDLVVPEPVPTRDGELLTIKEVEGVPEPRICVLFHWVAGKFLNEELTPAHLERVGILTAHLHEHVSRWVPPEGFTRGNVANLSDKTVARMVNLVAALRSPEDVQIVEAVLARARAVLEALGDHPEHYGLIHADLHQWNYLFHRREVRAIDFDDCGYGPFLYDLGVTLFNVLDRPDCPALRDALLASYRSVRPLPAEHEGYLETFYALRRLQIMIWEMEMRDHPAFHDWEVWVTASLEKLKAFVETNPTVAEAH